MRVLRPVLTIAFALLGSAAAVGDDARDEIRIGQTLPYSGPASGFGTEKEMVLARDCHSADGTLDQVRIHHQIAVLHIARERFPVR